MRGTRMRDHSWAREIGNGCLGRAARVCDDETDMPGMPTTWWMGGTLQGRWFCGLPAPTRRPRRPPSPIRVPPIHCRAPIRLPPGLQFRSPIRVPPTLRTWQPRCRPSAGAAADRSWGGGTIDEDADPANTNSKRVAGPRQCPTQSGEAGARHRAPTQRPRHRERRALTQRAEPDTESVGRGPPCPSRPPAQRAAARHRDRERRGPTQRVLGEDFRARWESAAPQTPTKSAGAHGVR